MQIDISGVKIVLTKEQLEEIDKQVNKKKSITERIQTLDDVYKELSGDLPFLESATDLIKNPYTKEEKSINAFYHLLNITKAYNKGIIIDWGNTIQYKYLPYKYFDGSSIFVKVGTWSCHCNAAGGLYFKSEAWAKDALSKFRDIYNDYWMI